MHSARSNTLKIMSPEGITFSVPLASPLLRFFAWGCDFIVILLLTSLLKDVFGALGALAPDVAMAIFILLNFAVYLGYAMLSELLWQGQTVGKRLFKLRVMDSQGLRLQASQVVVRNLLRLIDSLPLFYLAGGVASFLSPLSQRLGDMAANTVVAHTPVVALPNLSQLSGQKFNSLRRYPHLLARLRQRISPQEADLALQAVLRRDEFEDQARLALFARLAAHFKEQVAFPEEATRDLSAEQYVRNVLETLYRSGT